MPEWSGIPNIMKQLRFVETQERVDFKAYQFVYGRNPNVFESCPAVTRSELANRFDYLKRLNNC